jgi:hypothetical protein
MSKEEKASQLIALAPTEASRAAMKQALADPNMPSLDPILFSSRAVINRKRETVASSQDSHPRRPIIPESVSADVQIYSARPIREYHGGFRVLSARPGVSIGTIKGQVEPLEIYYATPDGRSIGALGQTGTEFQFDFVDDVSAALTLKRTISLADEMGLALFYLAEGSAGPYDRRFESLGLRVRQLLNVKPQGSTVQVDFEGKSYVMKPGDRMVAKTSRGAVAIVLINSVYTAKPQPGSEGDPNYVSILMYRLEQYSDHT